MSLGDEVFEVGERAVVGIDGHVVDDVVAVLRIAGVDGQQPDARHAQVVEIIEFGRDAVQVADAVAVAVGERTDIDFVEDPGALLAVERPRVVLRHLVDDVLAGRFGRGTGDRRRLSELQAAASKAAQSRK